MIRTKEKLKAVKSIALERPPNAGERWQGVPHRVFMEAISEELEDYGYPVGATHAATSQDKLGLVCSFRLKKSVPKFKELDLCVSLLTSNDRNLSPRMYYGCCDKDGRGYAFEEWVMGTLDQQFDVRFNVQNAVHRLPRIAETISSYVFRLQRSKAIGTVNDALTFMGELARDTADSRSVTIPWANVAKTDTLFAKGRDHTPWGLYRAFSEVTQGDPPLKQIPRLLLFADRLREAC